MAIYNHLKFKYYKPAVQDQMSDVCPYVIMIENGTVLLKGGALTCAYEYTAPDIGSSSEQKIAAVSMQFNNAVVRLGKGWTVQFELQRSLTNEYPASEFSKMTGFLIERQRELNFSYVKAHFKNRYFLIFTYQLPPEIEMKGASSFIKRASDEKTTVMIQNQLKDFNAQTSQAVAILSNVMTIERLDSDGLFSLLHSSMSMDWSFRKLPKDYTLLLDRAVTDCDLENSMPLKLGDYYIPIVTIKSFPSATIPAMFDALNKAGCPLRWSTRFMCYDREQAGKRIEQAEKKFHSARKSLGQMVMESVMHTHSDMENSAAVVEEMDAATAKAELYSGAIGYGDYVSNIMVFDRDLEKAEEYAKYINGLVSSCGFSAKTETFNAFQAFLSMQPGNIYADNRELFVATTPLSNVVPTSSIWAGLQNNGFMNDICGNGKPLLVCGTEFNIPYFLNLNIKDVGHTWISGPTGAGKSTLLALLEAQWLKYPGSKVIVFDKDRSCRNLTMCAGGTYIEPGKDETAFQPLAELDTPEDQRWAADFIEVLLSEQKVEVTPGMRKAIFETIKLLASKEVESRDLTSFVQYCDYEDPEYHRNDIVDGLSPYIITGQYGNLFDSRAANMMISDWTMIEMGTLMNMPSGVVAPALFYMFRQCEKKFDGKPVMLILDEAWVFLKNPTFSAKIVDWLKTLRKKHVFVVFATQEISDAAQSPIASTIISQCASKIYLPDDQATTPMLREAYKLFGLEESEIALLADTQRMMKKRDYLYKSSLGVRKFRLDLDALQLAILTTDVKDHPMLDDLEKKYGRNCGSELVLKILDRKKVEYKYLLKEAL